MSFVPSEEKCYILKSIDVFIQVTPSSLHKEGFGVFNFWFQTKSFFFVSFFFLLEKCNTFFILRKQEIERLLLALPIHDPICCLCEERKGRRWFLLRLQPLQLPDVITEKNGDWLPCLNPPSPQWHPGVWWHLQEHLPLKHHQGHLLPLLTAEFHHPEYMAAACRGTGIPASAPLRTQPAPCLW